MVGSGSAIASWKLQCPSSATVADQVLDERSGAVLEQGDALRREERVEELAEVLVLGRVDLERDERTDLADLHGLGPGGEDLGVVEHLVHVGVAADDVTCPCSSMCTAGPASRSSLNSGCGWASAVRSSTSGSAASVIEIPLVSGGI